MCLRLCAQQARAASEPQLEFALCTGAGDALGVAVGHTTFCAIKKYALGQSVRFWHRRVSLPSPLAHTHTCMRCPCQENQPREGGSDCIAAWYRNHFFRSAAWLDGWRTHARH